MISLGDRLLKYRKECNLSQEEVAEKLDVSRQTVSKWETNQSTPDFDKIALLCSLYKITADELIYGKKLDNVLESKTNKDVKNSKSTKALVISGSVFLYFIAVSWIILASEFLNMNDGLMVSIFMMLCAIATCLLVFYFVGHEKDVVKEEKEVKKENSTKEAVHTIISIVATCVYLFVSFTTGAWHITWLIWLIYAAVISLVDLIWDLVGDQNGK